MRHKSIIYIMHLEKLGAPTRALQREEALGDGATLGLGVEAAIRRSHRLGGARRAPKRAYVLEAEKSGVEVTLLVRAADAGAPFAARTAWRETETGAGRKHTTCRIV
jgi:hypothetical protein